MGKRVLRPGGLELTNKMLGMLVISPNDAVVELAPGLGTTARLTLQKQPSSYVAVERDEAAADRVRGCLQGDQQKCILGTAAETGLDDQSSTVVYGEAMLTMQTPKDKSRIIKEAHRVLRPGGRYGIHELALKPDNLDASIKNEILKELSSAIRVAARPLTVTEWSEQLEEAGFHIENESVHQAPMHLLEPRRMTQDEGLRGALRIGFNVLRTPSARKRILQMRKVFRHYQQHLCAVAIVATKPVDQP